MSDQDVTDQVDFGPVDDEALPLTKCVCGQTYSPWELMLSIYPDAPTACDACGRRFYFRNHVRVYEVTDETSDHHDEAAAQ